MKKLNRKGFTLIELLAVIVILAIVVVVTIPSVISSINKAKDESLKNAAATVTEWFTKQKELSDLGTISGGASPEYTAYVSAIGDALPTTAAEAKELKDKIDGKDFDLLKEAGITNTEGLTGKIYLNGTRICITLQAGVNSSFYASSNTNRVAGSGCPATTE